MEMAEKISSAFNWWVGELARVELRPRAAQQPWRAMLLRSGSSFDVHLRHGQDAKILGTFDPDASPAAASGLAAELARHNVTPETLVLRLSPDEVVRKPVSLPLGVRDVLEQVLRNQIDRVAPWRPEQALFAYTEAPVTTSASHIEVELYVTSKVRVERVLDALRAADLAPGVVDVGAYAVGEPVVNLIGGGRDHSQQRKRIARVVRAAAVATVALGLLGAGAMAYVWRQHADLDDRVKQAYRTASTLVHPREAEAGRQRDMALDQRRAAPAMSIVMEALSRALPDQASLDRFEVRNGVATITGKATNVPALIAPMEAEPHFAQVQFAAPTTRVEGETRDLFSISARLKPQATIAPRGQP